MNTIEHVGFAVAVISALLLTALTIRWGRKLRAEPHHDPRHQAKVGQDLNWWWLRDE